MKKYLPLTLWLFLPLLVKSQPTYTLPEENSRILFLGNSITYAGQYAAFVEAYLRLKHPDTKWEFVNMGLPSETVSGLSEEGHAEGKFPRPNLHERLDRVLKAFNPNLVFSCYGMNDGIYLPFDKDRFYRYQEGVIKMHDKITETGATIIHLTPPVYDAHKGQAYSNVLDIYASWLVSNHYTKDWKVIDIHWPMREFQEDKRRTQPEFSLSPDGIHPQELGHWLIAREILKGLGQVELADMQTPKEAFDNFLNGQKVLEWVMEKQTLSKDAWLTHTGHQRPGMKEGLPLEEAASKIKSIENKINESLK